MELFFPRAAERLFIVISGLVCIVLGYCLFRLSYINVGKSDAELVAKGAGFELTLRHVWPGVFFAAFGMLILAISILTQLKTFSSTGHNNASPGFIYQGGGPPPADSKTRVQNAISAIGEMLAVQSLGAAGNSPQLATAISHLATAQIDLVDVAYGQGSYDKFTEIASKSRIPAEFTALSEGDKQFYEDLRIGLQR